VSQPTWQLAHSDAVEFLRSLPDCSVDCVVTDPPYAEISRDYGRLSEPEWHALMDQVMVECRRILKPSGSVVTIIQPNYRTLGSMRLWVWEFLCRWGNRWNLIQDAYWWNVCAVPVAGTDRKTGLMRSSIKPCWWFGDPSCYRDQASVLWTPAQERVANGAASRIRRTSPSGNSVRNALMQETAQARGGATPFNLLPMANVGGEPHAGDTGHPAGTPYELASWWIRYLCPPGGVVCDPFSGSGTMGVAALRQGRSFVGSEGDAGYAEIARQRLSSVIPDQFGQVSATVDPESILGLFGEEVQDAAA
jgi:site-specific DNA-methyltransferase (adenine-specific)